MNAQEREKLVYEKCQLENMVKNYDSTIIKVGKQLHKELSKGKKSRNNKTISDLATQLKVAVGSIEAIEKRIEHIEQQLS